MQWSKSIHSHTGTCFHFNRRAGLVSVVLTAKRTLSGYAQCICQLPAILASWEMSSITWDSLPLTLNVPSLVLFVSCPPFSSLSSLSALSFSLRPLFSCPLSPSILAQMDLFQIISFSLFSFLQLAVTSVPSVFPLSSLLYSARVPSSNSVAFSTYAYLPLPFSSSLLPSFLPSVCSCCHSWCATFLSFLYYFTVKPSSCLPLPALPPFLPFPGSP